MGPAERALVAPERLQGCVRELEAEKAKMEVFRRELPISVRLVADGACVRPARRTDGIETEASQTLLSSPPNCLPHLTSVGFWGRRRAVIEWLKDELKAQPEGGRAEADDKSSWMSSAQLWTCGGGLDHTTGNGSDQAHKVGPRF
jgi:hypothetical protein